MSTWYARPVTQHRATRHLALIAMAATVSACSDARSPLTGPVSADRPPALNHVPGTTLANHVVAVEVNGTTARAIWHEDPALDPGTPGKYVANVSVGDDCSGTVVKSYNGDASDWTLAGHIYLDFTSLPTGNYCVQVKDAGLGAQLPYKKFVSATFTIGSQDPDPDPVNHPPAFTFGYTNTPLSEGDGTTVTIAPSDEDGDAVTVEYSLTELDGAVVAAGSVSRSAPYSTPVTFSYDFPDDGTYRLTIRVDDGTDEISGEEDIHVENVAPSATLSAPAAVDEGSPIALSLSGVSDPSPTDVAAGFTYAFDCGAGFGAWSTSAAASCATSDDAVLTVRGRVQDKDGGISTLSQTVTVRNVAPSLGSIAISPTAVTAVNTAMTVSTSFTDPGADTWTCVVTWGDGSQSTVNCGARAIAASHTYAAAGIHVVTVRVTDDDGASDQRAYDQYVVVYDPSAGFVTGGGWLNSTAGMYRPDPTLAGKATFGFVSKYLKGATTPSGNTEFQFHAAGMNFKSASYQWLVVSGTKATFKGQGTLDGVSGYGFLLSAIDGSPDKFRIKIWRIADDVLVYDNLLGGQSDDADPSTAISGGSIIIQTKK